MHVQMYFVLGWWLWLRRRAWWDVCVTAALLWFRWLAAYLQSACVSLYAGFIARVVGFRCSWRAEVRATTFTNRARALACHEKLLPSLFHTLLLQVQDSSMHAGQLVSDDMAGALHW